MTGVINLFLSVVSTTVERLTRRCGTYAYRKSADLKTLGFAVVKGVVRYSGGHANGSLTRDRPDAKTTARSGA